MASQMVMSGPPEKTPSQAGTVREVRLGEAECPRCRKTFTASYWSNGVLVQARCLSCDLKWPLPDVV